VATDLEPETLLSVLLEIEQGLGRVRGERFGPRTIDLDLLMYDEATRPGPELILPHPRLHERAFVLEPLGEIAPDVLHPLLGRTIRQLALSLTPQPGRELIGQRALVTGSTSGIGRAMALALAAGGADVIIHGRRSRGQAEQVAGAVRGAGCRSVVVHADLREGRECDRLVDEAWRTWNGLDIWINNAGADTLTGEAARWPFERKLDELLAVDLVATVVLSRAVGRLMQANGGVILNMGWDQAETGMEGDSGQLFGAAKGAVMAFSKSLAVSLAPKVRVNCLAPGWIQTAWGEAASDRWQERVRRETPLGRWGTPEDVAATARWLVSPHAAYLTGQVIRVNGGAVR
jgi:NAD(P)-dependent dehydrogenase (short-subunit alcohol dehydrogenase family)